ncbi:cytochrome P450 [Pyrenochaeta sp. DS3sAY3a]|nr:cytochrome P450 [Pyrenochaeta sp. DS3sAY3a]
MGSEFIPTGVIDFGLPIISGVACHLGYFIHGEHHQNILQLLSAATLIPIALWVSFLTSGIPAWSAFLQVLQTYIIFISSLAFSIAAYRLIWHPLSRFPGPILRRLSCVFTVITISNYDNHFQLKRLHEEYGDFVRIGPSEVSTVHPDAVAKIHGPGTKCVKGPWYDITLPQRSLHQTRDRTLHDRRRRIWDRGFSSKALKSYEERIQTYTLQLLHAITERKGSSMNMTDWFSFYSFDVMADLAFGKSFNMLLTGEAHFVLNILRKGQAMSGVFSAMPWFFNLLSRIPGAGKEFKKMNEWCYAQVEKRNNMEVDVPDVMSHLLEHASNSGDTEFERMMLHGDSQLIIIAGSDTTTATLTCAFYHLAKDKHILRKLREKLKSLVPRGTKADFATLARAPYLNGVINETLRLHPPVPSGVQRITPKEGLQIGGTYIPPETLIRIPLHAMGKNEVCYERPLEFVPERWTTEPSLVKAKNSFAPFSLGTYACVGKQLALMEIRSVLTALVQEDLDVDFAPMEDGRDFVENSMDTFTAMLPPLSLVFSDVSSSTCKS